MAFVSILVRRYLMNSIHNFQSLIFQYFCSDKKPPKEWPDKGRIVFENFYLRYSLDAEYVLKNLNIQIQGMEKVIITDTYHYRYYFIFFENN